MQWAPDAVARGRAKRDARLACVLFAPRFYFQCEGHEPTLLLIKTTQKEVRRGPWL